MNLNLLRYDMTDYTEYRYNRMKDELDSLYKGQNGMEPFCHVIKPVNEKDSETVAKMLEGKHDIVWYPGSTNDLFPIFTEFEAIRPDSLYVYNETEETYSYSYFEKDENGVIPFCALGAIKKEYAENTRIDECIDICLGPVDDEPLFKGKLLNVVYKNQEFKILYIVMDMIYFYLEFILRFQLHVKCLIYKNMNTNIIIDIYDKLYKELNGIGPDYLMINRIQYNRGEIIDVPNWGQQIYEDWYGDDIKVYKTSQTDAKMVTTDIMKDMMARYEIPNGDVINIINLWPQILYSYFDFNLSARTYAIGEYLIDAFLIKEYKIKDIQIEHYKNDSDYYEPPEERESINITLESGDNITFDRARYSDEIDTYFREKKINKREIEDGLKTIELDAEIIEILHGIDKMIEEAYDKLS